MKNIVLIGYRCTGKSTVGKALAGRLDLPFFDTDEMITRQAGMSIGEIVREGGWPLFRRKEREIIGRLSAVEGAVIAPGGGALEDPSNREALRKSGLFVWLTADVETIAGRMSADRESAGQRPPLTGENPAAETAEILQKREPVYRALADLTVDTSRRGVRAVADEIYDFLKKERTCRETPSERSSG